ncbi:MAG: carbohydrate ABC transporter permease [Lachnospiraceae bacterium]|nr:carbohydrate ABC transporter permease [Ruminococcus sp.]MCM1274194.1 carbohydrate ABC transporter permease [Lachnospiraceae bacterium]
MADSYNSSDKAYRRNIMIHSTIRLIVCIIITIIALLPIYIIVINSTRSSADITSSGVTLIPGGYLIENIKTLNNPEIQNGAYTDAFNIWVGYRNSLIIAGCSTILTVFFSALTAYGLTVYDFKLKGFCTTFILAIMMIPMQVVSTGFLEFMVNIKLYDNYIPLILPAIAAPSTVFFMLQYMQSSFPLDIVEAARIDGCGEFRTFLQISLPIFKPAFAVQAIFAFVASWNNYYTPSMLLLSGKLSQRTMPMMVAAIMGNDKLTDFGVNYLAVMLSVVPVIIIYLLLSKFIVKGVALGAVKG